MQYTDYHEQIIDAIIFGVNNDTVKLMKKKDENLTVDQKLDLIRTEVTRRQVADTSDRKN